MPFWPAARVMSDAVSLSSRSESGPSSPSSPSSSSSSSAVHVAPGEVSNDPSGSRSALSCSQSSGRCESSPKFVRRASSASLPVLGIGVGSNVPPNLVGFLRPKESAGCDEVTPRNILRTESTPEFHSRKTPCSRRVFERSQRGKYTRGKIQAQCRQETMRVLILGAPQVGKSSLVNSYRAAVTNNMKWPAAPVGICGFCGTTTVDPFPNHPTEPTWMCIDTPGRFYSLEDRLLLERLFAGVPWKTRLAGNGALRPGELEKLPSVPENRVHQCIVVVPATDLVEDNGWMSFLQWKSRYVPASDAQGVVMHLKSIVFLIRSFLYDASPFVVVTKMDLVGGAGNAAVRRLILSLLTQCIPVNRLYFCACPGDRSSYETKRPSRVDRDTRENLLRLHEDLSLTFRWRQSVEKSTQLRVT